MCTLYCSLFQLRLLASIVEEFLSLWEIHSVSAKIIVMSESCFKKRCLDEFLSHKFLSQKAIVDAVVLS